MFIDVKTAYFLLGFLYVVMPMSAYLYLKNYRSNAVKYWCFGGVLNGLGLVLISFRPYMLDHFPDFFTYTLVNMMIVTGYCMRIQSLRMDMKLSAPNYLMMAFILVFGIAYHLCVVFGDGLGPRVIFALSVISILLLTLAWNGKMYVGYFEIERMGFIAFIYAVLGFVIVAKVLLLIFGYEDPDVLNRSSINTILTVIGILAVIYSNLGYVALVLAKVEKDYKKSVADNREMSGLLEKRNVAIKEMMRAQAFSTVGAYGATVVHEVLQPLTALRFGLANLASYLSENKDIKEDDEVKARLSSVSDPAERAIGVIENLRRFMVERNVEIKPVPIDEVLANVINLQQSRLSKLGVNFSVVSTISNGHVLADQHQLERVVFNLLNNALDAIEQSNNATPNKSILIKLQYIQQKQFVMVKVVDSGEGIPEGMESKIFNWMETSSGGMGIGLALSRMLVESWQGTLTAYTASVLVDGLSGAVFELKLRATQQ
jgi:signal transduction histidine kinase